LTNQRAFRRRRQDYVRTLENKATTYEMLYVEAQNDIKILRERLALLERRLVKAQENQNYNDKCDTNLSSVYRRPIEVSQQMSESNPYRSIERQSNDDVSGNFDMSNGTYGGMSCFKLNRFFRFIR